MESTILGVISASITAVSFSRGALSPSLSVYLSVSLSHLLDIWGWEREFPVCGVELWIQPQHLYREVAMNRDYEPPKFPFGETLPLFPLEEVGG